MVRLNPYSAVQKRKTLLQAIKGRRSKPSATLAATDKQIDGKRIKKRSYATVVKRAKAAKSGATTTVGTTGKVAAKTRTVAATTTKTTTTKST